MPWSVAESDALYNVQGWGKGLFRVNEAGRLAVKPRAELSAEVDLHEAVEELVERGLKLPLLLRFPQIAERRLELMRKCFHEAFVENEYTGAYRPVYPIKVNQQSDLVEHLVTTGAAHGLGLEAGSKPELLICMAILDSSDALLLCNGYKDRAYVETALYAQRLGRNPVLVIEKLSEVATILQVAEQMGVRPVLGVRARLSRPGAGKWKKSSGDRAKFGLSAGGILKLIKVLKERGYLDCLQLLHFHIGSQVSNIRTFKMALREGTRIYTELARMGAPMGLMDVGGGVGVDYDGSKTNFDSSMNYSVREYAADVVSAVSLACQRAGMAHPDIITESGRATVAHCSVLLFDILGVESVRPKEPLPPVVVDEADVVRDLREVYAGVTSKNFQESWHDAKDAREQARQGFELGVVSLETLGTVEQLYWSCCDLIHRALHSAGYVPDEMNGLEVALADTYYGNFSLFQSVPDSWAIGQLFPVLPIHRLDEEPTSRAVIADLTCDSDGRIDRFVDQRDVKRVLEVHPVRSGERYVMAVCLVGAYQEILGDLHNLFGDTTAAHVLMGSDGEWELERVLEGDSVEQVIRYVQYAPKDLVHRIRKASEKAIRQKTLTRSEAAQVVSFFQSSLASYTYLGD
ncbi:MAG: arginine decarboxylase [Cognaticolwellia sp.]|jgi:arginine decarboxylase